VPVSEHHLNIPDPNNPADLPLWLTLVHTRGLGPKLLHKLLAGLGSAENIIGASDSKLTGIGLSAKVVKALRSVDQKRIDADLQWLSDGADRYIIPLDSAHYSKPLKEIADPPVVLYLRGDPDVLQTPQLAIVGSRKPGRSAERHAFGFARDLAGFGITVTSGLALGIDGCAHRGALDADGLTIAVTATGLDRVYPPGHQALAHEIAASGAIVSEFPIGTNPLPAYFPRRNRVIAGLCYGTLVVEAALKSGTLTTAAHATEQSREVFAIPGSIDNPQARGCHALLRAGAILVEETADILQQLAPLLPATIEFNDEQPGAKTDRSARTTRDVPPSDRPVPPGKTPPDSQTDDKISGTLAAFDQDPQSLDEIVDRTGYDIVTVTTLALELELDGLIESVAGGKFIRVAK